MEDLFMDKVVEILKGKYVLRWGWWLCKVVVEEEIVLELSDVFENFL